MAEMKPLNETCLIDTMDIDTGLTQVQFDAKYGRITDPQQTCAERVKNCCNTNCKCSKECCVNFIESQLPIINVVRTYKPRQYIVGDIFSGVSLGILNIPQGMGYGLLAAVAPIYGIYTAMFAPLIYVFFGTSKHIAVGVMALSSLLVADVIKRETVELQEHIEAVFSSGNDTTSLEEQLAAESIEICVQLTLLCGVFSYLMGIFRLGFFTDYLGDAFLGGFLCGANVRVLTSQVAQLLQLKLHPYVGPLALPYTIIDLFKHIPQANIATFVIAIVALPVILLVKFLVNEKFKSKLKVPIPIDFIVVVIVTLMCYLATFEERFGVHIIKDIPSGVPKPRVPPLERLAGFIIDGLILAIVGYILEYMMVKVFSQRHHYTCCPNQEVKALGVCNFIGAFFSCLPMSTSPPRCFIMEQTGGKSQFANVLSGFVVMLFLFFAGPLLEPMPVCILNVLILSGSVPIMAYYKLPFLYYRSNRYDLAIWAVTFTSMVLLTINLGIIIGIAFSVMTVVFRTQHSYSSLLAPVIGNPSLVNPEKYSRNIKDLTGVKIFQFGGPIYFATLSGFKEKLFKATECPSDLIIKVQSEEQEIDEKPTVTTDPDVEIADTNFSTPLTHRKSFSRSKSCEIDTKKIILDASAVSFMDTGGARMLALIRSQYSNVGIELIVAGCNESVREQMENVPECKELREKGVCPSVQDAIDL